MTKLEKVHYFQWFDCDEGEMGKSLLAKEGL